MIIQHAALRDFAEEILLKAGVPPASSRLVATSLVAANLRAVDSHGVQLLPFYIEQIGAGNIDAQARGRVVSESGACLLYDGENGIGQVVSEQCCEQAARLAHEHGIAVVIARESNHFGAAAFWAEKIAAAGLIAIVMCNASPLVAPWQGKDARFGTNPICMAVPCGNGTETGGWLLDMATTTVAMGKIFKASLSGQSQIPAGWAMDSEGAPTTDTEAAVNGMPMPLGGYKGSGLAMMAEILCGVLSGGAISTELGGIRIRQRPMRVSQFFLALEVSRFLPREEFAERLKHLVEVVKSASPASGFSEVLVAGEPEWRAEAERKQSGIPLAEGVWQSLVKVASGLEVPIPSLVE